MVAVKQAGMALMYAREQTREICLAAVRQNGTALGGRGRADLRNPGNLPFSDLLRDLDHQPQNSDNMGLGQMNFF